LSTLEETLEYNDTNILSPDKVEENFKKLNGKLEEMRVELETPIDLEANRTMINIVNNFFENYEEFSEKLEKFELYLNQTKLLDDDANLRLTVLNGTISEIHGELEVWTFLRFHGNYIKISFSENWKFNGI
jgi:hypothetical protein